MGTKTRQKQIFDTATGYKQTIDNLTIGTVVATNDPQQMGRVKIVCPHWGDSFKHAIADLPWATYVSPFGGQTSTLPRGPENDTSMGEVAYGMWAIPKIGTQVVVMCIDGDPRMRVYLGCIFNQLTTHTMPHGRFMYDDSPGLPEGDSHPLGPFTSREQPIEPLHTNLRQAFNNTQDPNYEFRTRGADYQVSGVRVDSLNYVGSNVQDDINAVYDGWSSTQGYGVNRVNSTTDSEHTDKRYDSVTYSVVTPGFHAFSMDDRQENCRIRVRTTSGHQIIMDDTNERIYIATAKGNNWIEMDQNGNIDMFTTGRFSVRSNQEINFTSDKTIRFWAQDGIHMYAANGDIRLDTPNADIATNSQNVEIKANIDVNVGAQNLNLDISSSAKLTGSTVDVNASGGGLKLTGSTVDVNASGGDLKLTGSGGVDIKGQSHVNCTASSTNVSISPGQTTLDAAIVNVGGAVALAADVPGTPASAASSAASASAPNAQPAWWTNKIPDHEPYARVLTANDLSHLPEFSYTDPQVGRSERGTAIPRGQYWRR